MSMRRTTGDGQGRRALTAAHPTLVNRPVVTRGPGPFTRTGSRRQDVHVAADPRTRSPVMGTPCLLESSSPTRRKLGSTGEIAETIAQVLRDGGHRALALPARDVGSLDDWDAVILGSAVYAAHWQKDARRFIERFREDLKARPLWLFSGGPLDRRLARADQPITPHGAEITAGLGARAHRTFGGRLSPDAAVDPPGPPDAPHRRLSRLAGDRRVRVPDRPGARPHAVPASRKGAGRVPSTATHPGRWVWMTAV